MKIAKHIYESRSLFFYQKQGGIYNELISALSQLKNYTEHFPQVVSVLNEVCYQFAEIEQLKPLKLHDILSIRPLYTMLSVTALANDHKMLSPDYLKTIKEVAADADIVTWNLFKKMLYAGNKMPLENKISEVCTSHSSDAEMMFQLHQNEELRKQIKEFEEQLEAKDRQLEGVLNESAKQYDTIRSLTKKLDSKPEEIFTFMSILEYITKNCIARNCDPILEMLNEMCVKAKDWKKVEKITEVKQKIAEANVKVVNNYNTIQNSNAFLGQVNNPQFPSNPQYTFGNGKQ